MKCLVLVMWHSLKGGYYYHRFAVLPASLLEAIQGVSSVELRCRRRADTGAIDVGTVCTKGSRGVCFGRSTGRPGEGGEAG